MEPKYVRKILESVRSSIMAGFCSKKIGSIFPTNNVCIFKITFMIDFFDPIIEFYILYVTHKNLSED